MFPSDLARYLVLGALSALTVVLPISRGTAGEPSRPRVVTQCPVGGNSFSLYDAPRSSTIASYNLVKITARMSHRSGDPGGIFTFWRSGRQVLQKRVDDFYNQNGWIGVSDDFHLFAINTSNGGAAGGWSVSIVRVPDDGPASDLSDSIKIVATDFSSRHHCKTRGENYQAIQWRSNTQLLVSASVYGTSDCGSEMGYTEGYVLDVTTGRIVTHMSEAKMLQLPYVCTYNYWQPGDPAP